MAEELMMQTSNIPYLPEEILTNILIRLPVKQLVKSKTVCKSWLALITSNDFIVKLQKHHFNHSPCLEDRTLVFLARNMDLYTASLDSHRAVKLHFERPGITKFLGSCNGLILCANYYCTIVGLFLVNSLTSQYKRLPMDPQWSNNGYELDCFGFGYDPITDDYKVVLFPCNYVFERSSFCSDKMVYSLKANSWKKCNITITSAKYLSFSPVLMNNNLLHWYTPSHCPAQVFCFDLSTEKWSNVPLPRNPLSRSSSAPTQMVLENIGAQSGRLCAIGWMHYRKDRDAILYGGKYVWVMKEYGVRESWVKLFDCTQLDKTWSWTIAPISYAEEGDDDEIWLMGRDCTSRKFTWYSIVRGKKTREDVQIVGLPHSKSMVFAAACTRSLITLSQPS